MRILNRVVKMTNTATDRPVKMNGNGSKLQSLSIALIIIYLLVSQVVVPAFRERNGGGAVDLTAIAQSNMQRISRLEAIVSKLEDVPISVASQTEAIQNLKVTVEKMDAKLDRHVLRDAK